MIFLSGRALSVDGDRQRLSLFVGKLENMIKKGV